MYVLKHIDLRKTPSLEFGMMIIFAYLPYGLAEGISLSGEQQNEYVQVSLINLGSRYYVWLRGALGFFMCFFL